MAFKLLLFTLMIACHSFSRLILILFFNLVLLGKGSRSMAQEIPQETPPEQVAPKKFVEFEGIFRLDDDFNPNEEGHLGQNLRLQKWEAQVTILLSTHIPPKLIKEVLLIVRSRTERPILEDGKLVVAPGSFIDYLKEIYIAINGVMGLPLSFKVGATEIPYGQDYDGTLSLQNDANHALSDPDRGQVKLIAATLDKRVKYIFDKAEFAAFTSNGNFLKGGLAHFDGFAFRVTKDVNEHLVVEVSMLHKGNGYSPELKPERGFSVGAISKRGPWTAWGEGFLLKNSAAYPNADYAGTGGISRIWGPGSLTFNAVGIKSTLTQFALGYDVYASESWTIGPTVRVTKCRGGNAGCFDARSQGEGLSIGFSVKKTFGAQNNNPTWWGRKALPQVTKAFGGRSGEKHNTINHPSGSNVLLQ